MANGNGKLADFVRVRTAKTAHTGPNWLMVNVAIVGTEPTEWATMKAFDAKAEELKKGLRIPADAQGTVELPKSVYMQVNMENIAESLSLNGNVRRVFTWVDARQEEPEPEADAPVADAQATEPQPEFSL
jgi:hypothetical protein